MASPNLTGGSIISRFQTLVSYMRADTARFPSVVPPANQGDIVAWVQWLKANFGSNGYNIWKWLVDSKRDATPFGGFFSAMGGTVGSAILRDEVWLRAVSTESTMDTSLLTGDVIQLTSQNLVLMRATTIAAMEWWAKCADNSQLGISYLNVIVGDMVPLDPKDYRVPTFYNPVDEQDASGIWWKFMQDSGYNSIITRAMNLSITEGQLKQQRLMAEASRWATASKVLGWINMSEPAKQLHNKANEYFTEQEKAARYLTDSKSILNATDDSSLSAKYSSRLTALNIKLNADNNSVYNKLQPVGLWPGAAPQNLSGLGLTTVAVFAIKGAVALALLGALTLAVNSMLRTVDEAGTLQRDIYKDSQDILNVRKDSIKSQIAAVTNAHNTGIISDAEYADKMQAFDKVLVSIQGNMNANATAVGSTSIMKQATVLGAVGIIGLIVWKAYR